MEKFPNNNEAERNEQFMFAEKAAVENPEVPSAYPEARHLYERRRNAAENFFIEHPQTISESEQGGGRMRTALVRWEVPRDLKKETEQGKLRITIYVPGMFETDKPNFGNYPLETKLAGSMLTGDTDAIFMLKGEGLNKEAYVAADGTGHGESLVADAAVSELEKSLDELKQKMNIAEPGQVEFEVVGYSEGSAEGASIAQKIVERGLGKVIAFTSIGGAGLIGKENQTETEVVNHLRTNAMRKGEYEMPKTFSEVGQDTYLINHAMIGDKKQGGYENSLGKAYVDTMGDVRNIAKWGARYLKSSLGIEEEVPHERVQAVFSKNKDFEKLVENGVPIVVLAGSKEVMFPAADVQKGVEDLRAKGGKVLLMITDMGHGLPHENPSGTAMTLALFRNKVGI